MYQRTEFIGRVGKDCELRYQPNGKAVGSFSVAVNEKRGETKTTIWYRVTVWERQAEVCGEYVKKGMLVFVEGRLTPDASTGGPRVFTRQDGTTGASYEVSASTVRFLSGKDEAEPGSIAADGYEQDEVSF